MATLIESEPTLLAPAEPAELDRRFYAYAIDHAIAWGVDAAAAVVIVQVLIEPGQVWLGLAAILGVVLLVGAVFALVLGLTGTSPGRAAAGIRVVRAGTDQPVGVGPALLRSLVVGVAGLPTLGLGVATLAWTAAMDPGGRRRAWHDHVAHTEVVDARPVTEQIDEPAARPRHVVNLTALRLVPVPARAGLVTPTRRPASATPAAQVPLPATPPPLGPPSVTRTVAAVPEAPTTPRHAVDPEPEPELEPQPEPAAAARPAAARQQLGFPLVPEPRPEPPSGGAHAARGPGAPATTEPTEATGWQVGFDTGETVVVDGLVLVGRRPEARHGEQARHLVALSSDDMSLSKTHAQLDVAADGALVVMDRGSTNGSFLVRHGVPRGLQAGKAATLVDGDRVRFGDREMIVVRRT